jgi:hypothetical protein
VHIIIHNHLRKTQREEILKVQLDYNDIVMGKRQLLVKVAHLNQVRPELVLVFSFGQVQGDVKMSIHSRMRVRVRKVLPHQAVPSGSLLCFTGGLQECGAKGLDQDKFASK